MAGDDLVELKFRLFDGTDIGPNKYDPSTTVGSLKEIILDRWPEGENSMVFRFFSGICDLCQPFL